MFDSHYGERRKIRERQWTWNGKNDDDSMSRFKFAFIAFKCLHDIIAKLPTRKWVTNRWVEEQTVARSWRKWENRTKFVTTFEGNRWKTFPQLDRLFHSRTFPPCILAFGELLRLRASTLSSAINKIIQFEVAQKVNSKLNTDTRRLIVFRVLCDIQSFA